MLNNSGLLRKYLMSGAMKRRYFFKRKDLEKFIGSFPNLRCNNKAKCPDDVCQHCPPKCETEDLGLVENAKKFIWNLFDKRKIYEKPCCKPKVECRKTEECEPKEDFKGECQPVECQKCECPKVECPREENVHEIKCVPCPPKKKIRKKSEKKVEKPTCFSIRCPPPGRPPQPCQCLIKYPTLKRDCPGPCPRPSKECTKKDC